MSNQSVFITGGAGYCGSRLVPQLLSSGYRVTVYDIMYFGSDFLPINDPNLKIVIGDIRDSEKLYESAKGHDFFVSLACISNDASFELDEKLSTSVNLHAFEPMVLAAKKAGIKRFIYASSSSVYGISDKKNVTEEHPLVPLTLYNKYKGMCEPILLKHIDDNFEGVIFRPATVCGYAPRLRLDLSVNILTNHGYHNNLVKVFGGSQLRPNLHIQDYCDAVQIFIESPEEKINKQIFNVGYQNKSIMEIAKIVKNVINKIEPEREEIKIEVTSSNDNRSYHINSDKIYDFLGFKPRHTIENAVEELSNYFLDKNLSDTFTNDYYHNVKRILNLESK
tara:strand:- start:2805 stop:3812 length:1008 start_codon:yes stop_codon:yes gene_type:complete